VLFEQILAEQTAIAIKKDGIFDSMEFTKQLQNSKQLSVFEFITNLVFLMLSIGNENILNESIIGVTRSEGNRRNLWSLYNLPSTSWESSLMVVKSQFQYW